MGSSKVSENASNCLLVNKLYNENELSETYEYLDWKLSDPNHYLLKFLPSFQNLPGQL